MTRRTFLTAWAPLLIAAGVALAGCSTGGPQAPRDSRGAVADLAAKIRRADYEGNRPELARLFASLAPYTDGPHAARARYWRGFALWRRALNGFNDKADPSELAADLKTAIREFELALAADPKFTDAVIGDASCWGNLAYLATGADQMSGFKKHRELLARAQQDAPDNPRLAWVLGATQFYTPAQFGGSQAKAIETYRTGLEAAKRERVADVLDPSWGQPELLMNLAFSNLNRTDPDIAAADLYARQALALVPYWHYIRDILIPQIEKARKSSVER